MMTQSEIARQRLHNQRLSGQKLGTPAEVVGWLGAVQAQDYAGAKWALRSRMSSEKGEQIDQALADGSIIRTHLLRPTWHFVTPADIRWLLRLSAPRVQAINASMYRQLELDGATLARSLAALGKALQGGLQLTRPELGIALQAAGIEAKSGRRLAYILMCAELEGLICSGGRRGKQFTYALLEERVPPARGLSYEAALAELARRYFMSRGPATLHDFAKWSGLTVADARGGLEAVRDELLQEQVDGQALWLPPEPTPVQDGALGVHVLSIYDEYISGYKDRQAVVEAEIAARLVAMGNALSYIILVEGQIVGIWRREVRGSAVAIETRLFTRLTKAEDQALAEAFQCYGEFLELPVVLSSMSF